MQTWLSGAKLSHQQEFSSAFMPPLVQGFVPACSSTCTSTCSLIGMQSHSAPQDCSSTAAFLPPTPADGQSDQGGSTGGTTGVMRRLQVAVLEFSVSLSDTWTGRTDSMWGFGIRGRWTAALPQKWGTFSQYSARKYITESSR